MAFKNDPTLIDVPLAPAATIHEGGAGTLKRLATTYNRIGGLLTAIAAKIGIPVEAVLAVWQAESGGEDYEAGHPILRFENHKFFDHWGDRNTGSFDAHFQFGGRGGIPGDRWENHKWRADENNAWSRFHGSQQREYSVFGFAGDLADLESACLSSSFGGPQILGSNFALLGYDSAEDLFDAFRQSERAEVFGFFDFCASRKAIDELQKHSWLAFARIYNGKGNAAHYGKLIENYFEIAQALDIGPPSAVAAGGIVEHALAALPLDDAYTAEFVSFVAALGVKHFKPYELLAMGHQHSDPHSPAYGLNTRPPRDMWDNIARTVQILDKLRELLSASIAISSAYRSPAYNKKIAGAAASQHTRFNALDFSVRSVSSPADWAAVLRQMRADGLFRGGIGVYNTFVHVDTRGTNIDW